MSFINSLKLFHLFIVIHSILIFKNKMNLYRTFVRRLLFGLSKKDPEKAHAIIKPFLSHEFPFRLLREYFDYARDRLNFRLNGIELDGPISSAAGLDKDCEMIPGLTQIFDVVTVGELLPYVWGGNERPRVERLETESLRNRMGYPFKGPERALQRMSRYHGKIPLNASVGTRPIKGNDQFPALEELYDSLILKLIRHPQIKMIEIGFSSPNTSGLNGFYEERTFERFSRMVHENAYIANHITTLLKLPPYTDTKTRDMIFSLMEMWLRYGGKGLTLTNTLPARDSNGNLIGGGISGEELYLVALKNSEEVRKELDRKKRKPIRNYAGGVRPDHIAEILERVRPHTLQLLTSFIYQGPQVVRDSKKEIVRFLDRHHYGTYQEFLEVA